MKKIVAVTFEDGTTIDATEDEIRDYVRRLDRAKNDALSRKHFGLDSESMNRMLRARKSMLASEAASHPRKPVTKAVLVAYRDRYHAYRSSPRGWKNAACLDFKIDLKTLNKRLKE